MSADSALPFVSVIVPVFNDEQRVVTCVQALLNQDYPRDRYEVIVVDNASTDGTYAAVKPLPVTLLSETATQSSFAARNLALRHARGEIYAFTDSDCTPARSWVREGVAALQAGADLVGGNVRFVFSQRPSGAEVCDSMANMQMERNIRERGVAKTANLFATKAAVEKIGPFPHDLRSGGDVIWTSRATTAGLSLVFCPQAEVSHPTRRLQALLKKQFRVGRGQRAIRAEERARSVATGEAAPSEGVKAKRGKLAKLRRFLRGFRPEPLSSVRNSMRQNGIEGVVSVYRVWGAAWMARVATTLGSLSEGLMKKKGLKQSRGAYATK